MRRMLFICLFLLMSAAQHAMASEEIHLAAAIGAAAIEPSKGGVTTTTTTAPASAAASAVKPYMIAVGVVSVAVIAAVATSDSSTSH